MTKTFFTIFSLNEKIYFCVINYFSDRVVISFFPSNQSVLKQEAAKLSSGLANSDTIEEERVSCEVSCAVEEERVSSEVSCAIEEKDPCGIEEICGEVSSCEVSSEVPSLLTTEVSDDDCLPVSNI